MNPQVIRIQELITKREALITRREGMMWDNFSRKVAGESLSYTEACFIELERELESIAQKLHAEFIKAKVNKKGERK